MDITKCINKECSKAKECYRILAEDNGYQSYADFKDICNKENDYKMFIKG